MTTNLQRIREATDIGELIGSFTRLRRMPGNSAVGLCPFHNEKTPSLRVNLPGHRYAGRFRCHGCDAHGDSIDFIRKIEGLSLPDAVRRLAYDAGIPLDEKPETREQAGKRIRDKREMEVAAWYFRQQWKNTRRNLNRAMAAGPDLLGIDPERWNLAGQLAEFYGARLRWIEQERTTAKGLSEFRAAKIPERRYREWLTVDLRRYAARVEFAWLVLSTGSIPEDVGKSHTSGQS